MDLAATTTAIERKREVSAPGLNFMSCEALKLYRSIHVLPNQWQFAFLFPLRPRLQGPRVLT